MGNGDQEACSYLEFGCFQFGLEDPCDGKNRSLMYFIVVNRCFYELGSKGVKARRYLFPDFKVIEFYF